MRVLVTNDDGIHAEGIRRMARIAVAAGHDVVVAAPSGERSGASASLSALTDDGRLMRHRCDIGVAGAAAYSVEASPAMIAFVGCRGAFGDPADLVLSGINHGPNTGAAILHSGTVGAALTAAGHDRPALAVSCDAVVPVHWEAVETVTARALGWITRHGAPGWVLNVNVPDRRDVRGIRAAPLAPFGAVQAAIGEHGEDYVAVTLEEIHAGEGDDSDAALLRAGWATATVLRSPWRDERVALTGLEG